jgi:uncharacterized protein (TIGR04141 family)
VYRALEWEIERDDRVFFLADGGWFEISADYLRRIDERLSEIDPSGIERPGFDPREHEDDYNKRLARHRPGRVVLDRKFAYFKDEAGKVEICDVFTAAGDFVHVKRDFEAEAMSHLFAQGSVSAELFTYRPQYRDRLRELLAAEPSVAQAVPVDVPQPRQFRVAFGIITDEPSRVPNRLPVFSRVHLAQMADQIERAVFRITVFGIGTHVGARPAADGPTEAEARASAQLGAEGVATTQEPV